MQARYAHISLDAGTSETYQRLKGGDCGSFEVVMANIEALASAKRSSSSRTEIIVSFLLQSENFLELPFLSGQLRRLNVNLEIKMQQYDERRLMSEVEVERAYRIIRDLRGRDECEVYKIVAVQNQHEALQKISKRQSLIDFASCYASKLGLSATVDPHGNVQSCCQYHQPTLGILGTIQSGFAEIWRAGVAPPPIGKDPRVHCLNCSPSDEFINRFVTFLKRAYGTDPTFLDWVEQNFVSTGRQMKIGSEINE
jgi:sulfatase maturation enzyme AslB (radical SAM superfamily)